MKAKILTLMIASALALVLLANFATALTINGHSISLSSSTDSKTITVTGDEAFDIISGIPSTNDEGKVSFTIESSDAIANITEFSLDVSSVEDEELDFLEEVSTSFTIVARPTGSTDTADDVEFTVDVTYSDEQICSTENVNDKLSLDIKDISVKGFGDDDDYWYPFDKVEVEIEVSFDGWDNDDEFNMDDLEWALYKDGTKFMDGDESGVDLDDGDEETITFTIELDEDVDELDDGDYELYIWATGEVDSDISEHDGEEVCASDVSITEMRIEKDFVILNDIKITPNEGTCGSSVQITADVWNIGSKDQDDVTVRVIISDLNIVEEVVVGDIDSLEDANFELTLMLPEGATEKTYNLQLRVFDEDGDIYENDEDDESQYDIPFVISDCGAAKADSVMVSATLESGGKAGDELVVRATITNSGNTLATYTLNAAGYTEWAESAIVEPQTVAVSSGESKDVMITLQVNKDAEGSNSFNLEIVSGSQVVKTQPVSVTIEKSGFNWGITGNAISGDNWYLWGIGALNVILVIIIIVVAIRVARS